MAKWTIDPCDGYVNTSKTPCECDDGVWEMLPSSLNITFSIINENGQSISYTRTKSCCKCKDIISYNANSPYYGNKRTDDAVLLYNIVIKDSCKDSVTVESLSYPNLIVSFNDSKTQVIGTIEKNETGSPRKLDYMFKINGEPCEDKTFSIYQQCWRGTDNGNSIYYDSHGELVEKNYALLLCGNQNATTSDSIVVNDLRLTAVTVTYDGGITYVPAQYTEDNLQPNGNIIHSNGYYAIVKDRNGEDLLKFEWRGSTGSQCGGEVGGISFTALTECNDNNTSGNYRGIVLHYATNDEKVLECANSHKGEEVCKSWEFEIKQCKIGLNWYTFPESELEPGEHDATYTAKALSGPQGKNTVKDSSCN